jgi:ATP-binding cassette, subfamily B, multidrug efflux pump
MLSQLWHNVRLRGALEGATGWQVYRWHVRDNWLVYLIGVVAVVMTDFAEVALPKIIQWTVDSLGTTGEGVSKLEAFGRYFWMMLAILAVQLVGRVVWRLTLAQQTHYSAAKMKQDLWDRARYLPKQKLESTWSTGELMNISTGDIGMARFMFGFTLVLTVDFFFILILGAAAMLSIDVELATYALLMLPVLPFVLDKLARKENRQHREAQSALSHLSDLCAQSVSTVRLQRSSHSENFWTRKLLGSADEYRRKRLDVVKTGLAFIPFTGFAPLFSYAILLWLGVQKVLSGELSMGGFVAMQGYVFLIQGPMIELGQLISEWQRSGGSLGRLLKVLREGEAPGLRSGGEAVDLNSAAPVIAAQSLSFSYPTSDRWIFKDISLTLNRGERLGISGPIGTGKSTLAHTLAGFERTFGGDLKFFGRPLAAYSHESLRQVIGYVHQKPFLFADTVRNNLKLNRDVDDAELWRILELTRLKEDVERFPQVLDTKLGEWGINLSGGQKQRLTLARVLVAKPQVLIFDDCLSAVDTVTEEKILQNLDQELSGQTLIWIAHRASTLKYCDRILELS